MITFTAPFIDPVSVASSERLINLVDLVSSKVDEHVRGLGKNVPNDKTKLCILTSSYIVRVYQRSPLLERDVS